MALLITWSGIGVAQSEPDATADNQQARDLEGRAEFMRGAEAYDAGRYAEALIAFERAFELTQRPALYYNIGLAHDRLRHDRQALEAYQHYMQDVADGRQRAQVEGRIVAIRTALEERDAERRADDERRTAERDAAATERRQQQEELERARREAEEARANTEKPSRWWIGVIVGVAVVAIGVGVGVGVARGGPEPDQSDFGSASHALVTW